VKKFFVMWTSQAFSLIGSAVVEFALAWYLTRETGKAAILATAVLVAMIPQIILGPLIGPFIDRWNRKMIMIFSDLAITLVTVVLVFLFLTDTIQVWHIYVAMVARAIGQTFQFPAMMAAVATIVPEKDLARANGLNQTLQGIITIAAPPLGAFLMEMLSMYWVLAVDIVTAVIAIGFLLFITIPQPARTTLAAKSNVIQDMVQSFRYLWSRRGLTILLVLVAILGLFTTPPFILMPVLVNEQLAGDVLKLGWINSTFGIGMILGGILLGAWGGFKKRVITSFLGIMIVGATLIGMGFASIPLFYFILVVCLLLGVGLAIANAPFMAIMNSVVAKDMQGRFFSLVGSITSVMVPLGLAVAGPLADVIGINRIFFISGAAVLVLTPLGLFSKAVLNLESHSAEDKPPDAVNPTLTL
jgi:DHA3 family macrolide efflux protein-like MFS transporter